MSCCNCAAPTPPPVSPEKTEPAVSWFRIGALIMLGGLSMYLSLAINLTPSAGSSRTIIHGILAVASGLALILASPPIFRNSLVPRITLEQLFLIGLCGSYAASLYSSITGIGHIYYEVVIILLAIYHLGQAVTRIQIARFSHLENQIPGLRSTARIFSETGLTEEPISNVTPGQALEIRAGEIIPADGIIESGDAFIEQLAHTGEPFPSPLHPGSKVLAGSRVLDGTIRLRTTSSGTDRELDRLLESCKNTSQSPADSLAGKILRFFIPSVVFIALLTVLVWSFIGSPAQALFNGLAVTIVACPCGIGLAIPLAIRNSHVRLRLLGIIPHSHDFLERLATIDTIAFDKTGTLSSSSLTLENISITPSAPTEIRSWLATIQRHSTHPIARPLWKIAEPATLQNLHITPIPARGISATFSAGETSHTLIICNSLYLAEHHPEFLPEENNTRSIHFVLHGEITGHATFRETSREGAAQAIDQLLASGYRVEILTGDSTVPKIFTSRIPSSTGLTTEQKASIVREKQNAGQKILLIGDGLNDTEAMRSAHASIALGSEAQAASSVASATLSHHDFSAIITALQLSRSNKAKLTRLLSFTLIYNFIGIALAASGLLHPVIAAILMLASSITVLSLANKSPEPSQ
ncbi:MAG: HAD-IC family P-type ATPase [Akkermansiaceae bacterium]|nr:HAD-IC family P-type ATPase [Akkermansiaceae bacterium]MDP4778890.1 HAD-IC family P-type ATPase [Akkermansiaceae bacterium]